MKKSQYRYIYGPVSSWRFGRSLGIDVISPRRGKVCSFNCVYCQLGPAGRLTRARKVFVPAEKIIRELRSLPACRIDMITFSGCGEPTLAKNLGSIIRAVKRMRTEKVAVLTNASLMQKRCVRDALMAADTVVAKLDVHSQDLFAAVNRPVAGLRLKKIQRGLVAFRARYRGKLALQIMFVKTNKAHAKELARLAATIRPDEIQINTPTRPRGPLTLSKKELDGIKRYFKGFRCRSVFDAKKKKTKPISRRETLKRRGKHG
jgi:wyosine [tRNA(Phe)-imidazoG37] synthetase (radical SAM superfamily)